MNCWCASRSLELGSLKQFPVTALNLYGSGSFRSACFEISLSMFAAGTIKLNNADLRHKLRHLRRSQSAAEIEHRSQVITQRLQRELSFQPGDSVGCYLAQEGEVNLNAYMSWLHQQGVHVFVPKVTERGKMVFMRLTPTTELEQGVFGILEPATTAEVHIDDLDVVLAPLVAYSSLGDRLGRGGGYYDRLLCNTPRPLYVGIAYRFQQNDTFQVNQNDVSLDMVVNELGTNVFRPHPDRFIHSTEPS